MVWTSRYTRRTDRTGESTRLTHSGPRRSALDNLGRTIETKELAVLECALKQRSYRIEFRPRMARGLPPCQEGAEEAGPQCPPDPGGCGGAHGPASRGHARPCAAPSPMMAAHRWPP